jgi:hypothetical protein
LLREGIMWDDYMKYDQVTDVEIRRAFNEKDRVQRETFLRSLLIRLRK